MNPFIGPEFRLYPLLVNRQLVRGHQEERQSRIPTRKTGSNRSSQEKRDRDKLVYPAKSRNLPDHDEDQSRLFRC